MMVIRAIATFVFLTTITSISVLKAQAPDTLWTRTYGGTEYESGRSVQQTMDEGFIIAGGTESFGAGLSDVYLLKVDLVGNTQWTRTYGGTEDDGGFSVIRTPDGGFIIAGYTESFGAGLSDVYLLKVDLIGDTLWTRTYGGTEDDGGFSVIRTPDGGFIIAGYTESFGAGLDDVYLLKVDSLGNTLWTRTYGGTEDDEGRSVIQTLDEGFIIAGQTESFGAGTTDAYLLKVDSMGDTLWTRTYGGSGWDFARSVLQTIDGGYIIAGTSYSFSGPSAVFGIRTDSFGNTLWMRIYGEPSWAFGSSVHQADDGGFIFSGDIKPSVQESFDFYLVEVDSMGDTLWSRTYGGTEEDRGGYSQRTTDNGFILVGRTFDSNGEDAGDIYLVRLAEPLGTEEDDLTLLPHNLMLSHNYPNPFNASTTISYSLPQRTEVIVEIYNLLGRKVETLVQAEQQAGYHQVSWDASEISSGIYFYRIQAREYIETKKMVLLK